MIDIPYGVCRFICKYGLHPHADLDLLTLNALHNVDEGRICLVQLYQRQYILSSSPLSRQKTCSFKVHSLACTVKGSFFFRMISSSGTGVIHSHLEAALPRSMAKRWLWVTPPLPIVG